MFAPKSPVTMALGDQMFTSQKNEDQKVEGKIVCPDGFRWSPIAQNDKLWSIKFSLLGSFVCLTMHKKQQKQEPRAHSQKF